MATKKGIIKKAISKIKTIPQEYKKAFTPSSAMKRNSMDKEYVGVKSPFSMAIQEAEVLGRETAKRADELTRTVEENSPQGKRRNQYLLRKLKSTDYSRGR